MFGQILFTHLKWTRVALALMSVVAFTTPAAIWRAANDSYYGTYSAIEVLSGFSALGFSLALIAFFCGFVVVAQAWQVDAVTRHVYALSLPIAWPRYVSMRFGAGALLLVIPTVAMWLGCLLVLAIIDVPSTLNAYPTALALRFFLGSLVGYSLVFAVQYLSGKKAAHVLLVALLAFALLAVGAQWTGRGDLLNRGLEWIFRFPGPLGVFGSDWMLVDV